MANRVKNGIQDIGVSLVVKNRAKFARGIKDYNKEVDSASDNTRDFVKEQEKSAKSSPKMNAGLKSLGATMSSIVATTAAVVAGVTAVTGAIIALGDRGSDVESVRTGFANLISPVLDAEQSVSSYVDSLNEASGGTIRELDLLKRTNLALSGTSADVRKAFAESIPSFLETARIQAKLTGEDVDFLFNSLVTGVKRASPLIIDNTGLTLDMTSAYEKFANEVGKTVDELTESEKQIAIINATTEAGARALEEAGGLTKDAGDRLNEARSRIANIVDNFAIGLEPLASSVLLLFNNVLTGVEDIARVVGPTLNSTFRAIGAIIMQSREVVAQTIAALAPLVDYILVPFRALQNLIGTFLETSIKLIVGSIPVMIKGVTALFVAAYNAILWVANNLIFPLVIDIATFIADFLTGFSPAKRGPLSTIDKGAESLMTTWLDGFVGGFSIAPIEQVASDVNAVLGNIANLGIKQVESRLGRLDELLRPFQEQLKLVEARFNAIREPAEAALRSVDRALESATQSLARGEKGSAGLVRQLDIQRQAIMRRVDAGQAQIDQARIQLALAESAQVQERTALEIQKARIGATEKLTKEERKRLNEQRKLSGGKKGAGGAGSAADPLGLDGGGGVSSLLSGLTPDEIASFARGADVGDANAAAILERIQGGLAGATDFSQGLASQFAQGTAGSSAAFGENSELLRAQFGRIGDSSIAQNIGNAFSGVRAQVEEQLSGVIGFFTDASQEGGFAWLFNRIGQEGLGAVIGVDILPAVGQWFNDKIKTPLQDGFMRLLNPEGAIETSIVARFGNLWNFIMSKLGDPVAWIDQTLFGGIRAWVSGEGEGGGLPDIINMIGFNFGLIPVYLGQAIAGIGVIVWNLLVKPILDGVNEVIRFIQDFASNILGSGLGQLGRDIGIPIPEDLNIRLINTSAPASLAGAGSIPQNPFGSISVGGGSNSGGVNSNRGISGAATGGMFSSGLLRVGENGEELIASAKPLAVFNNQFLNAMEMMTKTMIGMSTTMPSMVAGRTTSVNNNTTSNSNVTVNANMNGDISPIELANRLALERR